MDTSGFYNFAIIRAEDTTVDYPKRLEFQHTNNISTIPLA